MDRAFALIGESAVFLKCYTRSEGKSQLLRRALSDSGQTEMVEAVDEGGALIDGIFTAAAKGPRFYLYTEAALYELAATV